MEAIRPKVGDARVIKTREEAYRLLEALGAPERLLRHLALVGEAADDLIAEFARLGLEFDANLIRLGAAVHDAGKVLHPGELDGPGSLHEPAGEALLLAHGVQPAVSRCCVTHASWQDSEVSFEERVVALADKLWKGKREEVLELLVIDDVAARLHASRWDVFTRLDEAFERIASLGPDRLARSHQPLNTVFYYG
jgi:hypothetical protein